MKLRTTLIAAVVLAVLGAYAYFFEYKKAEEEKKKEEEEKKVFSIDWDKIKGLKITNAHGTFVVEKLPREAEEGEPAGAGAAQWRILEPLKTDAEDSAIDGLVNTLKGAKVEQVVTESAENLEPFGLKEPKIKVSVLVEEGGQAPSPLLLGAKSPVGYNSYAMLEGQDKVLLLSTNLNPQFDKDLYALRHKKLFAFKRDDVEGLRILRSDEPEVEFVKKGDRWEIVRPLRARAADSEVEKILNELTNLKAESFEDQESKGLAGYGLETPIWKIEVVLRPDQTLATLLLGSIHEKEGKGYIYAKRGERPTVVSLRSDLVKTLDRNPEELREKRVMPFKTWEVKKAELNWQGQKVTLEKEEGQKWRITAPLEARADDGRMSGFLSVLSRLEAEGFLEKPKQTEGLAEYGLTDPLARVALYREKKGAVEEEGQEEGLPLLGVLLLGKGKEDGHAYYATVEGEDVLCRVSRTFYEKDFPGSVDALRSRKVLDVSRYSVTGIESKGPQGTVLLERKETVWKLEKPRSAVLDGKQVNEVLTDIIDLEVDRFVEGASQDLPGWGLEPAGNEVLLKNEKGEELGAVLFSDKGPEGLAGKVYVKARGEPWVGLIDEAKKKAILDKLAGFRPEG
jgi:Domain of unknown function (DUF4340)